MSHVAAFILGAVAAYLPGWHSRHAARVWSDHRGSKSFEKSLRKTRWSAMKIAVASYGLLAGIAFLWLARR